MKKILLILSLLLILGGGVSAQKMAKFKKGIVKIGGEEFLKYDCKHPQSSNCIYTNLNGEKIILVKSKFLKKEYSNVTGQMYDRFYYEIEFLNTDKKTFSTEWLEYLFLHIYNLKVLNSDGSINLENAEDFIKIYGSDEPDVVFVD